jgi:hypothetical protein
VDDAGGYFVYVVGEMMEDDLAMMDAVLTDVLFWSILIIGIGCYVYDAIKTLVIVHRMEEREMGKMILPC